MTLPVAPTGRAAEQPFAARHAQGRVVIVMERAQADMVFADFFQRDAVGLDDPHNVGRPLDLVEVHFHSHEFHWPVFSSYSPR